MFLLHYTKNQKPIFNVEEWLEENSPKRKLKGGFWNDVYLEYDDVVKEFKSFLFSNEAVFDAGKKPLSPIDIYNAIEEYKIRIQKLMLIFNVRLYKTYNVNKKTNVRYIVMRAFWIDHTGKSVRWFSRNIGAENKVLTKGQIPKHMLDSVEEDILQLMWDQYTIDYNDPGYLSGIDEDGNNVIIEDD